VSFGDSSAYSNNKSVVGLLMSLSQCVEQHAGQEFEVYPDSPATGAMQFLFQSNWSYFIAPYCNVLIDRNSGTIRVCLGATNRNIRTNGSGVETACALARGDSVGERSPEFGRCTGHTGSLRTSGAIKRSVLIQPSREVISATPWRGTQVAMHAAIMDQLDGVVALIAGSGLAWRGLSWDGSRPREPLSE
jgi:hypothetical protein